MLKPLDFAITGNKNFINVQSEVFMSTVKRRFSAVFAINSLVKTR